MVDLKKEIKLSDLIPKRSDRPQKAKAVSAPKRRLMPAELVGLKIEAGGVTAAQITTNGTRKLVRVAQAPLEQGIVNGGEVKDPAALATALNEFFKVNELPRRGIRLGLANSRIGVRVIEVTGVDDTQQLENAVGFRAHQILGVPLDEVVVDFHILETTTGEDGQVTHKVLLVIAYRDSVDRYLAATDAANLELAGIDLDAFAFLRAANAPKVAEGAPARAVIAVSIDHDLTTLAVSDSSICQFTRVLEWGTSNVDAALVRSLKVAPEEAVEIRKQLSLEPQANRPVQQGGPPNPADVVQRELNTLSRELQSSVRFYGSQPGSAPVTQLIVSGALADIPGFVTKLGVDLGLSVTPADPFSRVELAEGVERPELSGGLVVAVGLGIED